MGKVIIAVEDEELSSQELMTRCHQALNQGINARILSPDITFTITPNVPETGAVGLNHIITVVKI